MKTTLCAAIVLITLAATAQAAIYKCEVDGETVFSERPCAANAQEIQVRVHRPDQAAQQESANRARSIAEQQQAMQAERRQRERTHEIANLEARIRVIQREMDAELAALRARKAATNNNLAGATLEQSIATEMQAVTAKHQARIDATQARLQQLYAEQSKAGQ